MAIRDWLLLAFVLATGLGVWGFLTASEQARAADARVDSVRVERDSAAAVSEARRDSLTRLRERETAVRDSLRLVLDSLAREAPEREEEVRVTTSRVDESLAELAERVRPELSGLVQQATTQLEEERQARNAQLLLARSQTGVWRGRAESFERELTETLETLDAVEAELAAERALTRELTEARDRWRDAAKASIFGLRIPTGVAMGVAGVAGVALGAAAF